MQRKEGRFYTEAGATESQVFRTCSNIECGVDTWMLPFHACSLNGVLYLGFLLQVVVDA